MIFLQTEQRRRVCECNVNYSPEGIFHPDRVMEVYDLLYLTQGSWVIWEEEQSYPIRKGQILLLEPGRRHFSKEKCTPGMRKMYLHFERLDRDGTGEGEGLWLPKVFDCEGSREISRLFEQMLEAFWSGGRQQSLRTTALLELLLWELSAEGEREKKNTDPLMREILQRFYSSPERFFSPEELAKDYGFSVRTISSRLRRYTGKSIHQYQMQMKLDMARSLLRQDQGRGLRDIAQSFGFYDEFQFSRLFKRQFGAPPSYFRAGKTLDL